jgi:hypothetical protein
MQMISTRQMREIPDKLTKIKWWLITKMFNFRESLMTSWIYSLFENRPRFDELVHLKLGTTFKVVVDLYNKVSKLKRQH